MFEHMINDLWTEANGVNLSEEWTGQDCKIPGFTYKKDTSGKVEDLEHQKRQPHQTVYGLKLG